MEYKADDDTVQEFIALFGSKIGHYYRSNPIRQIGDEKVEAVYYPVLGKPSNDAYISHLEGGRGLSILLNEEGPDGRNDHSSRACIDIDDYDTDPAWVAKKLMEHGIPRVMTISKSGGIHIHLLFRNLIPSKQARRFAQQVGAMLDLGNMDFFPKQDDIDYDADTDTGNKGNGLNLCYFGDSRVGWSEEGLLDLDGFMSLCYRSQLEADEIAALMAKLPEPKGRAAQRPDAAETARAASLNATGQPFYDGPPCLQKLAAMAAADQPVDSSRNNYLYNVAVFCKISGYAEDPDELTDALMASNIKHLQTPMTVKEVATVAKSVAKSKTANYKCREDPICDVCDRGLCDKRKYGAARHGVDLWFNVTIELVQPDDIDDTHDPETMKVFIRVEHPASSSGYVTFLFRKKPPAFADMKLALSAHGLPYMDNHDASQWNTEIQAGMRSAERRYVNRAVLPTAIIGEAIEIYITQDAPPVDRAAKVVEDTDFAVWKNRQGQYVINPTALDRYMRQVRNCAAWISGPDREIAMSQLGVELRSAAFHVNGKSKARRVYFVNLDTLRIKTRQAAAEEISDDPVANPYQPESDSLDMIFEEVPENGMDLDDDPFA